MIHEVWFDLLLAFGLTGVKGVKIMDLCVSEFLLLESGLKGSRYRALKVSRGMIRREVGGASPCRSLFLTQSF